MLKRLSFVLAAFLVLVPGSLVAGALAPAAGVCVPEACCCSDEPAADGGAAWVAPCCCTLESAPAPPQRAADPIAAPNASPKAEWPAGLVAAAPHCAFEDSRGRLGLQASALPAPNWPRFLLHRSLRL